jgi:MFS family permease
MECGRLTYFTAGNRKRVAICLLCGIFSQWSGTSLTAYYLHNILENIGIDSPNYQNMLNGFILMCNMFEAWFWASMVDRFGRRKLFLIAAGGMNFTFAIWIALTATQIRTQQVSFGKGVIAMIFFHNFFYNFAW